MKVQVDRQRCCSSGSCASIVGEVFDQDAEEGLVELLQEEPPLHLHEQVRLAADLCPAAAILLIE